MEYIGKLLHEARESAGVSLEEASNDLNIKLEFLLNIEEGKIGCFKDIFVLKKYLNDYAKYLGLESDKLMDEFNEYMFEYTSRIPIKEIEKQVTKDAREDSRLIASPYTKKNRKYSKGQYVIIYIIIILLVILAVFWSVKQITMDSYITNKFSINKEKEGF